MYSAPQTKLKKIVHVDMDCFYAAIEIRDNPVLANQPVAVGGSPDKRGVICTCNYIARQYGLHSAMATATAYRHCPQLQLLPVNMEKYQAVAKRIHGVFREFTALVEPLALDEAYLDVTDVPDYQGSATLIAQAIRQRIWDTEQLTASAGVAPNKFLAKIASGWKKPNGLFVIRPHEVTAFISTLPVDALYGVGKVTAHKLQAMGLQTCTDLQRLSLPELTELFGKLGQRLYEQCRGLDSRCVEPNRARKSLSVERTFPEDIQNMLLCIDIIRELHTKLLARIEAAAPHHRIKGQYIKIKFHDFSQTTAEMASEVINLEHYIALFQEMRQKSIKSIRLLGLGVHFKTEEKTMRFLQGSLF